MFERFKAYRRLYKSYKWINGCERIANLTQDQELLKDVHESRYLNEKLKLLMWRNRKMAIRYNLECIRKGL